MNHEPQDDLDRLLSRVPPPEAPAWFDAKVLARVRQEKEKEISLWALFRTQIIAVATCIILLTTVASISLKLLQDAGTDPNHPAVAHNNTPTQATSNEQFFTALDAFESYQEDNYLWNAEW